MANQNVPMRYTNTVMEELREEKFRSSGVLDYTKNASIGCCNKMSDFAVTTVIFFFLWLTWGLALPITGLSIGIVYLNDCPAQRYIPIYLIVNGCFSVVLGFSILYGRFIHKIRAAAATETRPIIHPIINLLLILFLIGWFICGNVWVYGMVPCDRRSTTDCFDRTIAVSGRYCANVMYQFTYWMIIAMWSTLGIFVIAFIIFAIMMCGVYCCSDQVQSRRTTR